MLYKNEIVQSDMKEICASSSIPFQYLENKTVLVTGATGMLAYYFTCTLMQLNYTKNLNITVLALVRNKEKAEKSFDAFLNDNRFKLLIQDVCDSLDYEGGIDYIFHAAGGASPRVIKHDPLGIIKANVQGTMNVMELAKKKNVKKVIYPSTREVYGMVKGASFITEEMMGITDQLENRSCYPESKRMAEQILKSYNVLYNIPISILRIAHVYGPGMDIDHDGRVMSDFISDVVNNRNIILKSTGEAERAFCYLTDAINAIFIVMLKEEQFEVYNIANEAEPKMIRDVAQMLVELFPEKNLKVVFEINKDSSGYCKFERVGLDTSKLMGLGWKPCINLREGMNRTVKSF